MSIDKNHHREIVSIKLDKGYPRSVDWSPDGTRLVVGDSEGCVQVFTAGGKQLWKCKENTGSITGLTWAPDGGRIAAASLGDTIRLYDADSGDILLRANSGRGNWRIAWSPNSKRLAWYVNDDIGKIIVRIFDADTGTPEKDLIGHKLPVYCVSWSPQDNMLASGATDTTIRIWDTHNGLCLYCLKGHKLNILDLCWSPDGWQLASCSYEENVHVWNTRTGECLFLCEGHKKAVHSLRWSPDGRILASGSEDQTIRLWDAQTGKETLCMEQPGRISSLAFSPYGTRLASACHSGNVILWDVSDFVHAPKTVTLDIQFQQYIVMQAATIGFSPPIDKVKPSPWVPIFANAKGDCMGMIEPSSSYSTKKVVAIFPDSRKITVGYKDGNVDVFDLETGEYLPLKGSFHNRRVTDAAVSPDGTLIATASKDETVLITSVAAREPVIRYQGHRNEVMRVCWSPDGKQLASIEYAYENHIHIWNAETGNLIKIYNSHAAPIIALSWSPNGKFIAAGDCQGNIFIWDSASTSTQYLKKLNFIGSEVDHLRWCPNSRYLLIGNLGGSSLMVDTVDNSIKHHWFSFSGVSALDWSPDGQFIAYGGYGNNNIRVHNAYTDREVKRFDFEEEGCNILAWSPNGGFIVSCHIGEVIRIWDTRDLQKNKTVKIATDGALLLDNPLPQHLRHLPSALAQMHRLNIFPPISLVRDIFNLLANRCTVESLQALLNQNSGIQALRDLHWPFAARIGLVALLLHNLPPSQWKPPSGATPSQIRDTLMTALTGEPIDPTPPASPISLLTQAADMIDDRLLSLLTILGPEAVAADPGLPLRILPRVKEIPPLSITQRRQLGIRISTPGISGQSTGLAPGADHGQIGDIQMGPLRSDFTSLLPTQLALPSQVQMYRHLRNELLFRAREMAEPPRMRPAVILLDVSPPTFGPIEKITRLAVFTVAQSLRRAGLPAILLTNSDGIKEGQWLLELKSTIDLVEIWLQRTLKSIPASRSLELARLLRAGLQENDGLEPIILVLSHPWFGAGEEIPPIKNMRGLFVQFPNYKKTPALSDKCEKYHCIETSQLNELIPFLAQLLI